MHAIIFAFFWPGCVKIHRWFFFLLGPCLSWFSFLKETENCRTVHLGEINSHLILRHSWPVPSLPSEVTSLGLLYGSQGRCTVHCWCFCWFSQPYRQHWKRGHWGFPKATIAYFLIGNWSLTPGNNILTLDLAVILLDFLLHLPKYGNLCFKFWIFCFLYILVFAIFMKTLSWHVKATKDFFFKEGETKRMEDNSKMWKDQGVALEDCRRSVWVPLKRGRGTCIGHLLCKSCVWC